MSGEQNTQDAGTAATWPQRLRAWIVIYDPGAQHPSRIVELPDGVDVTVGRSRGSTIVVDSENVSRTHARIHRVGEVVEIEDLQSQNGTHVNGDRIERPRRLYSGDEVGIGPMVAVVGVMSGIPRGQMVVADPQEGEARLIAEADRAVRYHRALTVALVRVTDDAAIDAMSRALRPMDLMAQDAGDDYLIILPELPTTTAAVEVERLLDTCRGMGIAVRSSTASCPEDGTTADELIGCLRARLRSAGHAHEVADFERPLILDPAMRTVYAMVARVASAPNAVLILGETGVGKELVAEAIHRASARSDRPLIKINCAALSERLLESELFGHERGAFTGADKRKIGFIEAAHEGTLFLDEIGEMPPALQAKLLRALEHKTIVRLGGTSEVAVDVRVIAATQRDLDQEARAGRFRSDLLFRIGGFTIFVPPLRDRRAEIVPLAERFLRVAARELARPTPTLSEEARDTLLGYEWPGNVRELRNAIDRALVLCGDEVAADDLPEKLRDERNRVEPVTPVAAGVRAHLSGIEREVVIEALKAENNNQTHAAKRLGISRRSLVNKMEKHGLKPRPKRRP